MGWQIMRLICISEKQKYFCWRGLTGVSQNDPSGKSVGVSAAASFVIPGHREAMSPESITPNTEQFAAWSIACQRQESES
jgi:hypothetical protein